MAPPFKRILIATDFGSESAAALACGVRLARDLGGSIHLLNVVSDPILAVSTPELYGYDWQTLRDDLIALSRKDLERIASNYLDLDIVTEAVVGPVAETIVKRADELGAGLIVMGTHGRGGVGHLFLGSVAERVLRRASCPVVTVRTAVPKTAEPTAAKSVAVC
jgi:nucleotide-binding universal stress UspA family protein